MTNKEFKADFHNLIYGDKDGSFLGEIKLKNSYIIGNYISTNGTINDVEVHLRPSKTATKSNTIRDINIISKHILSLDNIVTYHNEIDFDGKMGSTWCLQLINE